MPEGDLSIRISDWRAVKRHVQSVYPSEACGFLGGVEGLVHEVIPVDNVATSPDRFRMDSEQQVDGLFRLEANRLELLAIYHSHPRGAAVPSETDIVEWGFGRTLNLILCRQGSTWDGRAYRFTGSGFEPAGFRIIPG
jgi:proteasome lid subunit RPN8/RPN11